MLEVVEDIKENMVDDVHINVTYYENRIRALLDEAVEERKFTKEKLSPNQFLSCLRYVYRKLFKPIDYYISRPKCNIPYNQDNILNLLDVYMDICIEYCVEPSIIAFGCLTGIDFKTIKAYCADMVTADDIPMLKDTRSEMLTGRLLGSTLGQVALANNDRSFNHQYLDKQIKTIAQVNKDVSLSDIVQIDEGNYKRIGAKKKETQ